MIMSITMMWMRMMKIYEYLDFCGGGDEYDNDCVMDHTDYNDDDYDDDYDGDDDDDTNDIDKLMKIRIFMASVMNMTMIA